MHAKRFGAAWLALSIVLGLHVADEALTGFLSFYNPLVTQLRERFGYWPMPTFEFLPWITGLCVAVAVLLALSVFAFRGARWMRPLAFLFGTIMLLNGLGHSLGSLFFGRLLPGVYTAPLLLIASIYLLKQTAALGRNRE
jgi:hypothetical protein